MASPQRFIRKIDESEPRLLVSVCPTCGVFIAASPSPTRLRIAELAHHCKLPRKGGRPFARSA